MRKFSAFVSMPGLVLVLLTGCASSTSGGWTKPGMTQEELGRDTADCFTNASQMTSGLGGGQQVVDQTRYRRCMADHGYTVAPSN